MKFKDKRAQAIAMLRQWARDEVKAGRKPGAIANDLNAAADAVMQEFMVEHDVAGASYFEHHITRAFIAVPPGHRLTEPAIDGEHYIPLARHEFLSRQGLTFGYEDRL